jgi:ADP-ribose pyrophosphatase YjhB (NUDIX family)/uncharacterized protein YndB with AHSA1/START domain
MNQIIHEFTVKSKPNKIYNALTDETLISKWWLPNSKIGIDIGAQGVFPLSDGQTKIIVEIIKLIPNQFVQWKCLHHKFSEWINTTLSFSLSQNQEDESIVRFVHSHWADHSGVFGKTSFYWSALYLTNLKKLVEKHTPPFLNPVPVAVALIPYKNKLVGIRRGIEPFKGQIALPGGYIGTGETFIQALSRESQEETGILISDDSWSVFEVGDSLQSNRILIFGLTGEVNEIDLNFKSDETEEIVLIDENTSLAFPLHQKTVKKYFKLN